MAEYGGGDSGGSTALKEMQAVPVLCVCVGGGGAGRRETHLTAGDPTVSSVPG